MHRLLLGVRLFSAHQLSEPACTFRKTAKWHRKPNQSKLTVRAPFVYLCDFPASTDWSVLVQRVHTIGYNGIRLITQTIGIKSYWESVNLPTILCDSLPLIFTHCPTRSHKWSSYEGGQGGDNHCHKYWTCLQYTNDWLTVTQSFYWNNFVVNRV